MRRLAPLLVFALGACRGSFDPISYVKGLRLLAVVANPPEVGAGQMSTLTAWAVNPGGSAPTMEWDLCTLPLIASSGQNLNLDCVTPDMAPFLDPLGSSNPTAVTMPMQMVDNRGVPTNLGLPDSTLGFYVPIRLRLRADANLLTAIYRLRYHIPVIVNQKDVNPPNMNPAFQGIFNPPPNTMSCTPDLPPLDEATPLTVHSGQKLSLCAAVTGAETYHVSLTETMTEILSISWFATAGNFDQDVTGPELPMNTLHLDQRLPAVGSTIDLWAVVRDDRGGTAITHRTLLLQ